MNFPTSKCNFFMSFCPIKFTLVEFNLRLSCTWNHLMWKSNMISIWLCIDQWEKNLELHGTSAPARSPSRWSPPAQGASCCSAPGPSGNPHSATPAPGLLAAGTHNRRATSAGLRKAHVLPLERTETAELEGGFRSCLHLIATFPWDRFPCQEHGSFIFFMHTGIELGMKDFQVHNTIFYYFCHF